MLSSDIMVKGEGKQETIKDMCVTNPEVRRSQRKPGKKRSVGDVVGTDHKVELIATLFNNAKDNITKQEEAKVANKPKTGAVKGPMVYMKDGKAVLDIEAIVRAAEEDQKPNDPKRTVHESGNKANRAKRTHSDRWSLTETEQFYAVRNTQALQIFGTDFGMVANFLKNRTRQQVKSKYKKESRLNPNKVEYSTSTKMDLSKEAYQHFISELQTLMTHFA